ncbi:hypothetical protein [Bacillus testis]|uniref:hypothetical protein n=1 Tax=Bacillus testis TaxID=1622072 RepID=UPI00067F5EAD|nr:hypothetical protein [Bacillus testis]
MVQFFTNRTYKVVERHYVQGYEVLIKQNEHKERLVSVISSAPAVCADLKLTSGGLSYTVYDSISYSPRIELPIELFNDILGIYLQK